MPSTAGPRTMGSIVAMAPLANNRRWVTTMTTKLKAQLRPLSKKSFGIFLSLIRNTFPVSSEVFTDRFVVTVDYSSVTVLCLSLPLLLRWTRLRTVTVWEGSWLLLTLTPPLCLPLLSLILTLLSRRLTPLPLTALLSEPVCTVKVQWSPRL